MMQFDFNLSGYIQCRDEEYGRLAGLVIYPEAWLVTALIVKRGLLTTQQRVVPIDMVQSALGDDIYLWVATNLPSVLNAVLLSTKNRSPGWSTGPQI